MNTINTTLFPPENIDALWKQLESDCPSIIYFDSMCVASTKLSDTWLEITTWVERTGREFWEWNATAIMFELAMQEAL